MRQTYNIHAYPTHLINSIELANGKRITIRPALPQDAPLEQQFFERLSHDSLKDRFNGCAPVAQYSKVDYVTRLGLVATVFEGDVEIVIAQASYRLIDEDTADFGLAVSEAWRRIGIGTRLVDTLAAAAKGAGARWLIAEALPGNIAMLALMLRCGFTVGEHPADRGLVQLQRRVVAPGVEGRVVHRSGEFLAALRAALPQCFEASDVKTGLRLAQASSGTAGPSGR
ncbi:GNAT family N-acetyltransferase [Niveibacterium sp. 24ML]|uniref:GNAT family N-acetyltransferase n=1 Tax=Niveibacterium sp. 24ML TaxID=2985512 RepID=UPI002270147A|nr:GNAT family N-acetyltransferase [Niveibacterium sp. 24ML]MCX9156749.1 GNAT family N-acetyltransferase [Niveibacterium sp. 24ML]